MVKSKLHFIFTTAVWIGLMTSSLYAMENNDKVVTPSRKRKIEYISYSHTIEKTQVKSVRDIFKTIEAVHGKTCATASLKKAIQTLKCNEEWAKYFHHVVSGPSRQVNSSGKKQEWISQFNTGISFIEQHMKESIVSYDPSCITLARDGFNDLRFYSSDNHARESLHKVLQDFNDQGITQEWKKYLRDIVLDPQRTIHYRGKPAEWVRLFHRGTKHVTDQLAELSAQAQDKLRKLGYLSNPSEPVQPLPMFDHWSYYDR